MVVISVFELPSCNAYVVLRFMRVFGSDCSFVDDTCC